MLQEALECDAPEVVDYGTEIGEEARREPLHGRQFFELM
jgi:hypothetical protein